MTTVLRITQPRTIPEFMAYLEQPEVRLLLAQAAHEQNRAYCALTGDLSQVPWEQAPEWQRHSALLGVAGALSGNSPEAQHESWMAEKVVAGWVYGPTKDAEAKTHPCLVLYSELPTHQRVKDYLFIDTIKMHLNALYIAWGFAPMPDPMLNALVGGQA